MRQIEFRGKRVDGKGWVYGHYVYRPDGKHLIYWKPFDEASQNTYHEVIPSTVGQFTGLMDKKGNKIFEGDVLTNNSKNDIIVAFYNGCFINNNTYITLHTEIKDPISRQISFEITSNIHDNPTT